VWATLEINQAPSKQKMMERVRRAYKPDFVQCTALDAQIDDHSSKRWITPTPLAANPDASG